MFPITEAENRSFENFLILRIQSFLHFVFSERSRLSFHQSYIDILVNCVENAILYDGIRLSVNARSKAHNVSYLPHLIHKYRLYADSPSSLWFALTSGFFLLPDPSVGHGCSPLGIWWEKNPIADLSFLIGEWNRAGGSAASPDGLHPDPAVHFTLDDLVSEVESTTDYVEHLVAIVVALLVDARRVKASFHRVVFS